jgi:hypothetical protein
MQSEPTPHTPKLDLHTPPIIQRAQPSPGLPPPPIPRDTPEAALTVAQYETRPGAPPIAAGRLDPHALSGPVTEAYAGTLFEWLRQARHALENAERFAKQITQLDGQTPRPGTTRQELRILYKHGLSIRTTFTHTGTALQEEAKRMARCLTDNAPPAHDAQSR